MDLSEKSQEKKWVLFMHFCFYELVCYEWITSYCTLYLCIFLKGIFTGFLTLYSHLSGKFQLSYFWKNSLTLFT